MRFDLSAAQTDVLLNVRSVSSVVCGLPPPGLRGLSQSRGSWVKPFCATAAFNEPWGSAPSEHFDRCQGLNSPSGHGQIALSLFPFSLYFSPSQAVFRLH